MPKKAKYIKKSQRTVADFGEYEMEIVTLVKAGGKKSNASDQVKVRFKKPHKITSK